MAVMFILVASLTLGASSAEEIDRHQLILLIDAAQENDCHDVGFDYEGRQFSPGKSGVEEMKANYTGSISRRADEANLVDLYFFGKTTGKANRSVVAVFNGTTEFSSRQADQKNASISIAQQGPLEYAGTGNYREIWLNDLVKKFARSQYLYEFEGVRRLEGQECVVVRFRLVYDNSTPKNETVSDIFWIDLNRGGHVVRYERRFQGENLATLTMVRLERFESSPGKAIWLPVSGKVETHMTSKDEKLIFVAEPILSSTYDLLPMTLRFDRGLKDDYFTVKPKVGDAVSDEVRKARYEFGQYMVRPITLIKRSTDKEIKVELERMLKDSKIMANELKASSPAQEESGWWSRWPWAVVGLSTLGAGLVYYRQQRA